MIILALEGRPGGFVWSYFTRNTANGAGIILSEGPEQRALKKLTARMANNYAGQGSILSGRVAFYGDDLIKSLDELVRFAHSQLKYMAKL